MDSEDITLISALMAIRCHRDADKKWTQTWHKACANLQMHIASDRDIITDEDWDNAIKYVEADGKAKAGFIAAMREKYD